MHLITYKANELSTYYNYLTESVFGSNALTNTYNTYKTQIENKTDESNLDTLVEAYNDGIDALDEYILI